MTAGEGTGRFLAVIPARGGSRGLPGKNRMAVQGIGLVARAVEIAQRVEAIRWIVASTDDEAIALQAKRAGALVPFLRPPELSGSRTPMVDVLEHALSWFRSSDRAGEGPCEGLVLLQPTSPMRKSAQVADAVRLFSEARRRGEDVAAVHTVSRVPDRFLPWNLWRAAETGGEAGGSCGGFRRAGEERRDRRGPLLYRNGVAVVLDPGRLHALTLREGRVLPYRIEMEIPTIDTLLDLLTVEHLGGALEPSPEGSARSEETGVHGR